MSNNNIKCEMNSSTELELSDINTEETSLKNIDKNLEDSIAKAKILSVSESYIPSLRALGSHLRNLTVLKIPHCGVRDLDGLSMCSNIKEIYLPFNEIVTIASIMFLTKLEVIDFESNNISNIHEIDYLSILCNLKLLIFLNNPIADDPTYLPKIKKNVPDLNLLDDTKFNLGLKEEIEANKKNMSEDVAGPSSSTLKMSESPKKTLNIRQINKNQNQDFQFNKQIEDFKHLMGSPSKLPIQRPQTAFVSPTRSYGGGSPGKSYRESPADLLKSSINSGYSQLTTGKVMVGSAARSLRGRGKGSSTGVDSSVNTADILNLDDGNLREKKEKTKNFKDEPDFDSQPNSRPGTSSSTNSGTNTNDLNYTRPNIQKLMDMRKLHQEQQKQRPATSYHSRRQPYEKSKTTLESFSRDLANSRQSIDSDVYSQSSPLKKVTNGKGSGMRNSIEEQLADVEYETDALLKDLKEWRVEHDTTLKNLKSKFNQPDDMEKQVLRPIPPTRKPDFERTSTMSSEGSEHPMSRPNTKPRTPENGDHENPVQPHKPSNARMRQFQRRVAQHKSKSSRDRMSIEKPILSNSTSPNTSPQQVVHN
jgi:hypothetical protein